MIDLVVKDRSGKEHKAQQCEACGTYFIATENEETRQAASIHPLKCRKVKEGIMKNLQITIGDFPVSD